MSVRVAWNNAGARNSFFRLLVWFGVPSSANPLIPVQTTCVCVSRDMHKPQWGAWPPQQQVSFPSCCQWTRRCPAHSCGADSLGRPPSATATAMKPGCSPTPHEWPCRCEGREGGTAVRNFISPFYSSLSSLVFILQSNVCTFFPF